MKVLLTGANGQLGRSIQARSGKLQLVSFGSDELDIGNPDKIAEAVAVERPQVVINAAAYTAVDQAESNRDKAFRVNEQGAANLARCCGKLDIPLIHVSTDYVFDGTASIPYDRLHATSPLGVYGDSKLAGERAVQQYCPKHLIIRTAWVFSEFGNNFLKTMLGLAGREQLTVVDDQHGGPTYAGHLAEVLLQLAETVVEAETAERTFADWGIYHFCGEPETTWYEFAQAIFNRLAKESSSNSVPEVLPINSSEYPTRVKRPMYSMLDCQSLVELLDKIAPHKRFERNWRDAVDEVVVKLVNQP